jgi:uncharacterized membrane protein YjjB (DUF3815 family)
LHVNPLEIGGDAAWSGLFSAVLGVLLTAPRRHLTATFLCGLCGRLARDLLVTGGVPIAWATLLAAIVIVFVAVVGVRGHRVSPVVLVSSVLPLGASVAVFNTIVGLMRISALRGEALDAASVALSASLATAFTITLAIAMGLTAGIGFVRLLRRESTWVET